MPLESCVVCLDTSEWMRNGDYMPTRLDAQQDAANVVCMRKLNENPEVSVRGAAAPPPPRRRRRRRRRAAAASAATAGAADPRVRACGRGRPAACAVE